MTISVSVLTNPQIEALHPQIAAIYRDAFVLPPYQKPEAEIENFAQTLLRQLDREDFRFVGAFAGSPERIVGFAYGYTSTAGQWWYEAVRPALPKLIASQWLENSFQFVEIAVAPRVQGQGIGTLLHDHLLCGMRHGRAILSTLQASTVAHHL